MQFTCLATATYYLQTCSSRRGFVHPLIDHDPITLSFGSLVHSCMIILQAEKCENAHLRGCHCDYVRVHGGIVRPCPPPTPTPVTAKLWLPAHCTAFFFCSLLVQHLRLGPIPDHVQLQPAAYKTKLCYPTRQIYDNNPCSKIKFKYTFLETGSQINNIVIVINLLAA